VTDEIAESLGLDEAAGALIADVTEDSPAAKAQIKPGDVIVTFNGRQVGEMRHLPRMVADTEIGREVAVEVWRKGKIKKLSVTLGELDEAEQVAALDKGGDKGSGGKDSGQAEALGMTLSRITPALRKRFDLSEESEGVIVTEIDGDSPAAEKGIRPGDIIVEVGQEEVKTPGEVAEKVKAVANNDRKSVLLLLQRSGDLRFVAIRVDQS
jgi:serine protease Do